MAIGVERFRYTPQTGDTDYGERFLGGACPERSRRARDVYYSSIHPLSARLAVAPYLLNSSMRRIGISARLRTDSGKVISGSMFRSAS